MRHITTAKSTILYAVPRGGEWSMQNKQGEQLYVVSDEDFQAIYQTIGEEKNNEISDSESRS